MTIDLFHGDCRDVMRTMLGDSVDSIVTDPPYGLSFMGKGWDHGVPGVEFWMEALRVAKPGAHLLAFGGTRTFHRLAVAIEDAGWEIRDTVMWVYGSGFPKSHNISKAIDREAGAEREVVGFDKSKWRNSKNHKGETIGKDFDYYMTKATITAPSTDLAKQWDGWGTALKPAWEPIIVARKPLQGTVAENVLRYGTGGINVDGCRVVADTVITNGGDKFPNLYGKYNIAIQSEHIGRWPANLIHDGSDEVLGLFPNTAPSKSGGVAGWQDKYVGGKYKPIERTGYDDAGSAARFFYCAKASKADRDEGLDNNNHHPTVKPTSLMRYLCRLVTQPGGIVLDPFMGSGSTGKAATLEGFSFIGIEQDEEYVKIAEARINTGVLL